MTIKEKIIEYRNSHPETRTVLGTILGEFDRVSKNPSDEQCFQLIKKMIESNLLTGQLSENVLLSQFIPTQLTNLEITKLITDLNFKSIAECMKFFKENYTGRYDGKMVSKIFNNK